MMKAIISAALVLVAVLNSANADCCDGPICDCCVSLFGFGNGCFKTSYGNNKYNVRTTVLGENIFNFDVPVNSQPPGSKCINFGFGKACAGLTSWSWQGDVPKGCMEFKLEINALFYKTTKKTSKCF